MIKKSFVFLCLFVFCYSVSNSQDGTRAIDYNTRSTGRGGVSIGFFDNPSVMLTNPAGMSFLKNDMLDINSIFMIPPPKFTNYKKDPLTGATTNTLLNDAVDGEKTLYILPSLSYTRKISNRLTLGAGVFTTGGMGADFSLNHELYKDASGNYIPQTYHSRFSTVQGGLSGAFKITDKFSVGITAQLLWASLEFKNPFSMSPLKMVGRMNPLQTFGQHFAAPRDTTYMGLGYTEVTSSADMKELNAYSFAGKVGLAYKFSEKFTIGVSYSAPVPLKFKNGISNLDMSAQFNDAFKREVGNVMTKYGFSESMAKAIVSANFDSLHIDVTKGFTGQYDISDEFEIPQSVGFGVNYNPSERLRLGLDFEWINWEKSFDKMKLTLTNGTNSNINILLGQGGVGQPDFNVDFLMNWKDAIIIKVGGEYDLSKKSTIRLGYAYGTNPVPEETAIPIIPAVLVHHIMAGFSYMLTERLNTNVAIEHGLNNKVTNGGTSLVASEYNLSTVELRNLLGHLSLTYNFK
jgi:long-subunit fatty acid transport protein